jgi:hypothetical protein
MVDLSQRTEFTPLSKMDEKVLLGFWTYFDRESTRPSLSELATEIGSKTKNFTITMRNLVAAGYVITRPVNHRKYMISQLGLEYLVVRKLIAVDAQRSFPALNDEREGGA